MKIIVNGKELEVSGQRLLIEELREAGYAIPSLCYAPEAKHEPSCMVCMVRNEANDQMIPSCATYPTEGLCIDTMSDDVTAMRCMGLELLLSDHRADCEAPCTIVCPARIDVARVLLYLDRGKIDEARSILAPAVDTGNLPCADCKAPCEKACRRRTVDKSVDIRNLLTELAEEGVKRGEEGLREVKRGEEGLREVKRGSRSLFSSKLGRYTEAEKERLRQHYTQPSRCLHCACEGKDGCWLRECATAANIRSPRYGLSSRLPVKDQIHVVGRLYYEPAKCIRCGLCVYNSSNGFTFEGRGFDMQVVIPEQNKMNVDEKLAELCPTGALFLRRVHVDE